MPGKGVVCLQNYILYGEKTNKKTPSHADYTNPLTCEIELCDDKTAHFPVDLYNKQPEAHLCSNDAVKSAP